MKKYLLILLFLCQAAGCMASGMETVAPAPTAKSYYEEARKSLDAKQWKPALASLQKAVALDPDNADIHNLLGYTYRKQGNLDKAFEHYAVALRLNPRHLGAHEYLGEAYLQAKDLANAEKQLAELAALCNSSCEQYRDLEEAVAEFKKHL
ncbi:tetratricopeptide repeat protein [Undibacterium sp.]|jgi:Flp pilus assembly protein TadD|uniref:tetratricopeptide repeat protein n=1 Tax=Undibacterium sp. TaxID=1914977 RepID=UPI002B7652D7|nr:tetratricopeptide repeat protein [Undibacterium sp.]HTD04534.1 tetratricopeptide repeat protein [Undibacterium sp.]